MQIDRPLPRQRPVIGEKFNHRVKSDALIMT